MVGEYEYAVDMIAEGTHRVELAAEGAGKTMLLKGATADVSVSCKWDESVGCGKTEGGDAYAYEISVNSAGKRTYKESDDKAALAYCEDLTKFTKVKDLSSTSSVWDCSVPSGTTRNNLAITAPSLEDYGGARCEEGSGFFHEDAAVDETACGSGDSLDEVTCICDAFYARFAQKETEVYRSMECKLIGVAGAQEKDAIDDIGLDDLKADDFIIISEGR